MTTAFQPDAFQNDAFQVIDATTDSALEVERMFVPQFRTRWFMLPLFWAVGMVSKIVAIISFGVQEG